MKLRPNVAGTFYPADKEELTSMLTSLHRKVSKDMIKSLLGDIGEVKAIIAPHAGYIFSGLVAMHTYALLHEAKKDVEGVLLWGPSHYYSFYGAAQPDRYRVWVTPLGEVEIKKYNSNEVLELDTPYLQEHSLEVHLPFLQYFYSSFYVKPLVFGGWFCFNNFKMEEGEVLVVSSDLSHYLRYEEAVERDMETLRYILNKDVEGFERRGDACGRYAIACLLRIAKKEGWKAKLVKYMNSGDVIFYE